MAFQKRIEDFICEKCGTVVKGTGYTNHCPECLWSKHVDMHPGDRLSQCNGMMEPKRIESNKAEFVIIHRCLVCGHEKRNKMGAYDNYDKAAAIQRKIQP